MRREAFPFSLRLSPHGVPAKAGTCLKSAPAQERTERGPRFRGGAQEKPAVSGRVPAKAGTCLKPAPAPERAARRAPFAACRAPPLTRSR